MLCHHHMWPLTASCKAVLQRATSCLTVAPGLQSDPLHRETQNPKVTGDASLQDTPRDVPTGAEIGSEKEVKWGVNIPSSPEQLKEELKYVSDPPPSCQWACYSLKAVHKPVPGSPDSCSAADYLHLVFVFYPTAEARALSHALALASMPC